MTAIERPNNRLPGMRGIIVQAGSGAPESEGDYVGLYIQLDSFETLRDFPFNVYHLDVEVVRSADLLNLLLHMAELEAEQGRLNLLLAGILRNRYELLAPHHAGAIKEHLGYPTDEKLDAMIISGKVVPE